MRKVESLIAIFEGILGAFLINRIEDLYRSAILFGLAAMFLAGTVLYLLLDRRTGKGIPPASRSLKGIRAALFSGSHVLIGIAILYLCEYRWAVSKWASFSLTLFFTGLALALWFLVPRFRRALGRKRRYAGVLHLLFLCLAVGFTDSVLPRYVFTENPGVVGDGIHLFRGMATRSDLDIILLIQSEDPEETMLVRASRPDDERTWTARCDFRSWGSRYTAKVGVLDPAIFWSLGPAPSPVEVEKSMLHSSTIEFVKAGRAGAHIP